MDSEKLTLGQFVVLEVINGFKEDYKRLPYLYELCKLTGKQPNHLHCIISNLVEMGELDYPSDLLITPTMRDVLELLSEGVTSKTELQEILGLHHITICKVIQELKERDLIPENLIDDISTALTFVKVCKDVFITAVLKGVELAINLNGSSGYLKNIEDGLKCIIYYDSKAFEIELHPDEVELIPCYKENKNEYPNPSKRNRVKVVKTYIRFHRH